MIVYILCIFWALSLGLIEARADHYALGYDRYKHYWYTVSRGFVFLLISFINWWYVACAICMFPWFHDGMYYVTRNYLAGYRVYPMGWFDKGSTAWLDKIFCWPVRFIFFTISLIILIFVM